MTDPAQQIGRRIRAARRAQGLSIKDLAARASVAPNTVSAIEAGRPYRPGSLRSVLDALGIEPLADTAEYPPDVELVRDAVGGFLLGLDPERRAAASQEFVRLVIRLSQNQPNG